MTVKGEALKTETYTVKTENLPTSQQKPLKAVKKTENTHYSH